jgi:hypothetical protein
MSAIRTGWVRARSVLESVSSRTVSKGAGPAVGLSSSTDTSRYLSLEVCPRAGVTRPIRAQRAVLPG